MPEEEKPDLAKKAIQVIFVGGGAAGVAFASGASPTVTLAAGAAASSGQAGELVSGVWGSLRQRWNRNGQATLEAGARAAQMDMDELLLRLRSSPARLELLAAALEGGAHAELEAKITALGSALARGALADGELQVSQERLFVGAMAEFEAAHIGLLEHIAEAQQHGPQGVATDQLGKLPWLTSASLFPLLAALQRHGAVISHGEGGVIGGQSGPSRWTATDFGSACLDRLREAGHEHKQDSG